jgi:hypothetical protein
VTEHSVKLSSVNQHYLGDAMRLIQERFRQQETLTWATNCGYPDHGFDYVLLSSERVFSVRFRADDGILGAFPRRQVPYGKEVGFWNAPLKIFWTRKLTLPSSYLKIDKERTI